MRSCSLSSVSRSVFVRSFVLSCWSDEAGGEGRAMAAAAAAVEAGVVVAVAVVLPARARSAAMLDRTWAGASSCDGGFSNPELWAQVASLRRGGVGG